MNRLYANLGIGMFWLFAAGLLYLTGTRETQVLAVCLFLAVLFFWSAFKIFLNPQLGQKDKKNLMQKLTDESAAKARKKMKK